LNLVFFNLAYLDGLRFK
jgi:hypothetical protein